MSTAIFCLTKQGYRLGQKIKNTLVKDNDEVDLYALNRDYASEKECIKFDSLTELIKTAFPNYSRIIFIMALGIVVRVIAEHIKDKTTDPAVVVVDEAGNNVISILSGHLGGANSLSRYVAAAINARPIITTATDVRGLPAVDEMAREFNLAIESLEAVRRFNGAIVNGEKVHIYFSKTASRDNCTNVKFFDTQDFYNAQNLAEYNVVVTNKLLNPTPGTTMFLRPRNLVVGMGCRSGTPEDKILAVIRKALEECQRSALSVRALATIDRKKNEPGLVKAAETFKIPVISFSAAEINAFMQSTTINISSSEFVQKIMGVPAVCEPAALMAARKGELILPKQNSQGVTIALTEDQ